MFCDFGPVNIVPIWKQNTQMKWSNVEMAKIGPIYKYETLKATQNLSMTWKAI